MILCYLALGSNLKNPSRQLIQATQKIKLIPKTIIINQSSSYLTKAWGDNIHPHYINLALAIKTLLPAIKLLNYCQNIEKDMQRVRKKKNDPRTIDIDILIYGNHQYNLQELIIPHPRMPDRDFVLIPLSEINKDLSSFNPSIQAVKRRLF